VPDRLRKLRSRYPWPATAPGVNPDWGPAWFSADGRSGHAAALSRFVRSGASLILELGSFVGRSTAWFLRACPGAHVIAIDTWNGSPEHHADPVSRSLLPVLYPTFQTNLWHHRHRLTAVRETTRDGMRVVHEHGLAPELVYVDADHSTAAVVNDILVAMRLFPSARIVGDDWRWDSVRDGVRIVAFEEKLRIGVVGSVWWLIRS
jgi:hypothetical protein